jgi:hypothetical protein
VLIGEGQRGIVTLLLRQVGDLVVERVVDSDLPAVDLNR